MQCINRPYGHVLRDTSLKPLMIPSLPANGISVTLPDDCQPKTEKTWTENQSVMRGHTRTVTVRMCVHTR